MPERTSVSRMFNEAFSRQNTQSFQERMEQIVETYKQYLIKVNALQVELKVKESLIDFIKLVGGLNEV